MRYLIALIFPPLAVLLCGKPFQSVLNFFLSMCFYFPGALHAMLVVSSVEADRRSRDQLRGMKQQTKEMTKEMRRQGAAAVHQASRPIASAPPASIPAPAIAAPKTPLFEKIRDGFAAVVPAIATARASAIRAYQELPEWAQPITWGLSAGSVASVAIVIFILVRR